MKPILNYTTSISVDKTVAEIQQILSQCGDISVLTSYDRGIPSSISFRIEAHGGTLSFLLPAKIDNVLAILKSCAISKPLKTREQAARVAWRIIKDWVEAQVALVRAEQVELAEAFFPFVQLPSGETLYGASKLQGFSQLALPMPEDKQ